MKNKLINLNNHLFEALERLNDEDLKGEELAEELERAKAITTVSQTIINNADLALKAQKHADEMGYKTINTIFALDAPKTNQEYQEGN